MENKRIFYQIPDGFLINHPLERVVGEEKCYIFCELDNKSLRRVMDYCYLNTAYTCVGTNNCYYCTVIEYVKDEMRDQRVHHNSHDVCCILHGGW